MAEYRESWPHGDARTEGNQSRGNTGSVLDDFNGGPVADGVAPWPGRDGPDPAGSGR